MECRAFDRHIPICSFFADGIHSLLRFIETPFVAKDRHVPEAGTTASSGPRLALQLMLNVGRPGIDSQWRTMDQEFHFRWDPKKAAENLRNRETEL